MGQLVTAGREALLADLKTKSFGALQGRDGPQGFVRLIDVLGDDNTIVDTARLTAQSEGRDAADDRTLLRYLMRHRHTTPFEFCEVHLHVRIPMDSWRQMVRHRTASINEYSTRYSEAIDERATTPPTGWRLQSTANRQGSGAGCVTEFPSSCYPIADTQPEQTAGEYLTHAEELFHLQAQLLYEERLRFGVAKEVARKDLPLSTFTEAHWKVDLHNLLHYLSLRLDPHAQLEIRRYAEIIAHEIVAKLFPVTWDAFVDYRLEAISLTRLDQFVLRALAVGHDMVDGRWVLPQFLDASKTVWPVDARSRERDECLVKLQRLGLVESDVLFTPA